MATFQDNQGKQYTWVDSDTIADNDRSYRIVGYNARETSKVVPDNETGLPRFIMGQQGGDEQSEATQRIAAAGGFNIIESTGEFDSYGRELIRIKDAKGNDLSNTLIRSGAVGINRYTDEQGLKAYEDGLMARESGKVSNYGKIADEVITKRPIYFKDTPLMEKAFGSSPTTENDYAQQVLQVIAEQRGLNLQDDDQLREATKILDSGNYDQRSIPFTAIAFRSPDRTKEGIAYNQFSTSWNQGWAGMARGLMGFSELMGVTIGNEEMKEWGGEGVKIYSEELKRAPRLESMDYRDVDDVWDAYRFISNNLAMSAPYLVTLTTGALLTPVTAGVSMGIAYGSVGGSYAGQVWNDIEGPKGRQEAGLSLLAGTAMAVIDAFGFKGLISPSRILSKEGREYLAEEIAKRSKGEITVEQARESVRVMSVKKMKETMEGMGNFAYDLAKQGRLAPLIAKSQFIKSGIKGGLREAGTEAAQEGLGYLASKAMSEGGLDKNFDMEKFKNLLAQAAVAGGTLGTGFATAGELVQVGKNKVLKRDLEEGKLDSLNPFDRIRREFNPEEKITDPVTGIERSFGNNDIIDENKKGSVSLNVNSMDEANINRLNKERILLGKLSDTELNQKLSDIENRIAKNDESIALNSDIANHPDVAEKDKAEARVRNRNLEGDRRRNLVNKEQVERETTGRAQGRIAELTPKEVERIENDIAKYEARPKDVEPQESKVKQATEARQKTLESRKRDRTFWDKLKNFKEYLPKGYRAAATSIFRPELLRLSETLRKLASLIGSPLGSMYSGRNVEHYSDHLFSNRFMSILKAKNIFQRFGYIDTLSNSKEISEIIYRYMNAQKLDPTSAEAIAYFNSKEYIKHKSALEITVNDLNDLVQTMFDLEYEMMVKEIGAGAAIRRINDPKDPFWMNTGSFDWKKVRQNESAWKAFMAKNARKMNGEKYTYSEINDLYIKISNQEEASDFSLVEGDFWQPNTFKTSKGQNLSTADGFSDFANTDIILNMTHLSRQYAKYIAYTTYFGAGGKDLDYMLGQMKEEGLSDDQIAEVAQGVKDIIDAGTGNFNNIKSKNLNFWQRKASFFSTLIGLPFSVLASFAEFAMLLYNDPGFPVIKEGIKKAMGEMITIFKDIEKGTQNPALENVPNSAKDSKALHRLMMNGLVHEDAVGATRLGMGETDVAQAWFLKKFFKVTLISPLTLFQRILAQSQVAGFVSDRLRLLAAIPEGYPMNNRQQEVYTQMLNMGMDVDTMVAMYIKYDGNQALFDSLMEDTTDKVAQADMDFMNEQMEIGSYAFINERVQNPKAYNRPLLFQDPHYQLFLQFNGFISTFTANIIPKLWIDYTKNGSPRMRYNTFALMIIMFALAGLSQWLKDYIKFKDSTPYLTKEQLLQRALMASGILGSGERVLQAAFPLYRSRDESIVDRVFGETIGGAPFVRNVANIGKSIGSALEGKTEQAVRQGLTATPLIAPATPIRNIIHDSIFNPTDIRPYK